MTIGFKTESACRQFLNGQLRTINDVVYATAEPLDWSNNRHLQSVLDYVPSEEYEFTIAGLVLGLRQYLDPEWFRYNVSRVKTR